ncbi:MAG: LacI family transcriptional regulator, partial [Deinococcota bacterium]|nr:LacI family transcriptional regulator [Deinococcota bacterium]
MATVKEVAKAAKVSVATVSRVISGAGYVSPQLKERVQAAMATLSYHPSAVARSLRTQQTYNVGVLIPQIDHPFFSTLTFAIEGTLFKSQYRCFVCSAEENPQKEEAYIDALLSQRVGGVILVPTGQQEAGVRRLLAQGVPVVLIDRDLPTVEVDRVLSDNYHGAAELTRHLVALGHRRLGVIGTSESSQAMSERLRGTRETLLEAGLEPAEPCLQAPLEQFGAGYETAIRLLARSPRPTAIMALTDVMAVGVMHAATDLGLTLPGDLSVTGFDDIPLASHVLPALTTVAQPLHAMGSAAAELLRKRMAGPGSAPERTVLPTRLV